MTGAATGQGTADEGLDYFVPEIARALADGLRKAGLVVGPTGEIVAVTIEELPHDRVLLSAKARGNRAELEGSVESMDALVDELVTRLVPMCAPSEKHAVARLEPGKQEPRPVETKPIEVKPETKPIEVKTEPARPTTTVQPASIQTPPTPSPPQVDSKPTAPQRVPGDPYGPDARIGESLPASTPTQYERNRVVVHTLPDPPLDAPAGTGAVATEALYAVLQHRLRLAIVPLGSGITTVASANEESQRARARSVVMGRLDSFSYFVGAEGPVARVRLELMVVAEGRVVLRRMLLAETAPGAVAAGEAPGGHPAPGLPAMPAFPDSSTPAPSA